MKRRSLGSESVSLGGVFVALAGMLGLLACERPLGSKSPDGQGSAGAHVEQARATRPPPEWLEGGRLAWQQASEVHLVDPATLEATSVLRSPDGAPTRCLHPIPDTDRLLLVSFKGQVSVWSEQGALVAASRESLDVEMGCGNRAWRLAWSASGRLLVSSLEQSWLLRILAPDVTVVTLGERAGRARFLDDDGGILVEGREGARIFSLDGALVRALDCEGCRVSPDGSWIAQEPAGSPGTLQLTEVATGTQRWQITDAVAELWSPSGEWLHVWTRAGPGVLSATTGQLVASWTTIGDGCCGGYDAAWVGDVLVQTFGDRLAIWSGAPEVKLVDLPDALGEARIEVAHRGDRFVAFGRIFDLEGTTVAELGRLGASAGDPTRFSPNDAYIEGDAREGRVVWSTADGRVLAVIAAQPVATSYFSPDGQYLFVRKGAELARWSERDGEVLVRMPGLDGGR